MEGTPVFPGGVGQLRFGRLAVATVAFACMATASGCASSSSQPAAPTTTVTVTTTPAAPGSASNSTPASTPSTPVTGPPACPTSSLQVKQGVAQGYAGGVYEVIDFTNTSGSPCTLYGYPGVSLVTGPPYTQIGLAAKRSGTAVKLITLAPGATASASLQIVDALNFPSTTCDPVKTAYLRVYPPNQTAPVYLANASEACAQPVQTLFISTVQAGSGSAS